jgi:hypothetical protein
MKLGHVVPHLSHFDTASGQSATGGEEAGEAGRAWVLHVVAESGEHERQALCLRQRDRAADQRDEAVSGVRDVHAVEEVVVGHLAVRLPDLHWGRSASAHLAQSAVARMASAWGVAGGAPLSIAAYRRGA